MQQQQPFPFNSAGTSRDLAGLDINKGDPRYGSPRRNRHPRQSPPARLPRSRQLPSEPSRRLYGSAGSNAGSNAGLEQHQYEQHQYEVPEKLLRSRRSVSDHRLDPEQDPRPSNPSRPVSLGRPRSTRSRSDKRSQSARELKRSQSLGDRMAQAVSNPREPTPPSNLLLYHVSKPEPRGRSTSELVVVWQRRESVPHNMYTSLVLIFLFCVQNKYSKQYVK